MIVSVDIISDQSLRQTFLAPNAPLFTPAYIIVSIHFANNGTWLIVSKKRPSQIGRISCVSLIHPQFYFTDNKLAFRRCRYEKCVALGMKYDGSMRNMQKNAEEQYEVIVGAETVPKYYRSNISKKGPKINTNIKMRKSSRNLLRVYMHRRHLRAAFLNEQGKSTSESNL